MDHASVLKELFAASGDEAPSGGHPVEAPEPEEVGRTSDRDDEILKDLFASPPSHPSPPSRVPRSTLDDPDWPEHNYNEAYGDLEARHPDPRRRHRSRRSDSALWEIQELLEEERAPARSDPVPSRQAPWPNRGPGVPIPLKGSEPGAVVESGGFDPDAWLSRLAGEDPQPVATEAHLVRTLQGDPPAIRVPLFDRTQTLYTRDSKRRPLGVHRNAVAPVEQATSRPTGLSGVLGGPRGWVLKAAGVALGLKVGLALGYAAAALL